MESSSCKYKHGKTIYKYCELHSTLHKASLGLMTGLMYAISHQQEMICTQTHDNQMFTINRNNKEVLPQTWVQPVDSGTHCQIVTFQ